MFEDSKITRYKQVIGSYNRYGSIENAKKTTEVEKIFRRKPYSTERSEKDDKK